MASLFPPTPDEIVERLEKVAATGAELHAIGSSREGRALNAMKVGDGPLRVSITAGAHADEPAGPMAAIELIEQIHGGDLCELGKLATWFICPHVNPDSGATNAAWYREEVTLENYARRASRELPGEDVEFCYPGPGDWQPRPENEAVAAFLRRHGPFDLHASLHGMGFAEGAWWLIGKEWAERVGPLRKALVRLAEEAGLGLHDMERHGEKGFTRIARGFCTTPTSTAMKGFFLAQGDDAMARRFLPSSMEFVQGLGGDPLLIVTEMPIFRLTRGGTVSDPPAEDAPFRRFRPKFDEARKRLLEGESATVAPLIEEFGIAVVPWDLQATMITKSLAEAVKFLASHPQGSG